MSARTYEVVFGRRWTKVAEKVGGQRSAAWFQDTRTGCWYVAESWTRPNLNRPLNADQSAYVESVIASEAPPAEVVHADGGARLELRGENGKVRVAIIGADGTMLGAAVVKRPSGTRDLMRALAAVHVARG